MQLTRIFAQLGKADLPLAGGKGANLGEMVQAGLPVPPGFVLLTEAYRMFVRQAGIQAAIENLANDAHPDSQESLDTTSARIRALFDGHAVPAEVAAAITEAYAALGGGPVAVRSSATAEDLPDASFAGQQETYLNIQGPEAVVNACRRCWSSLWTGRAIAYRLKNGIAPGDVALAVVVQQLVAADVAGVLFTVDPVSGRRDRMTIDGAWGLGESVVSGVVSPDHWVADGKTGAVITEQLAAKTVMTVRTAEGTEERPVPAGWQLLPVLDAAKVAALVDLGRRTAAYFGSPQDIEWALSGGQFYLLQSRPVTTLFPVPEPAPGPDDGLRVYVSFYAVQGVIEPITPAGIAAFRATVEGVLSFTGLKQASAGRQYLAVAAGRLFIDVTDVMRRFGHRLAGNFMDVDMQQALQDLLAREKRLRPAGGVVARGVNKLLMLRTALRALYAMLNPEGAREGARRRIEADIAALEQESRGLTGVPDRVRFVRRALGAILPTIIRTPPLFVPALVIRSKLLKKLAAWGLDPALMDPVGRSIPHNPTTEMDLALWQLSRTLLEQGAEPRADHPAVQAFLEQYGHRATREIDMGVPRWRDDPQQILHILSGYMTQGAGVTDPEHH
ncbi:MAG TPA: PEP/pyruvate-binding domain-containing protein, partial [Symbiobacteriaceae bacterium]|nr:PEP/pyruvate-binding domain-containing protein [Symbiobacteriaceae bacterium]